MNHHTIYPTGDGSWTLSDNTAAFVRAGFASPGAAVDWIMKLSPCSEGHAGYWRDEEGDCIACLAELTTEEING